MQGVQAPPQAADSPSAPEMPSASAAPEWGGDWKPVVGVPVVLAVPEPSAPPLPEIMSASMSVQQQQQHDQTMPLVSNTYQTYQSLPPS